MVSAAGQPFVARTSSGPLTISAGTSTVTVTVADAATGQAGQTGQPAAAAGIGGGGETGMLAKFTTPTEIGNSLLQESSSRIGLGTQCLDLCVTKWCFSTPPFLDCLVPAMTDMIRYWLVQPHCVALGHYE